MRIELRRWPLAGLVSDMPLGEAACLSGLSRRSMVDALIAVTSANAASDIPASSPLASSAGIHWSIIAFMYGPHGIPISSHRRSSAACASSE